MKYCAVVSGGAWRVINRMRVTGWAEAAQATMKNNPVNIFCFIALSQFTENTDSLPGYPQKNTLIFTPDSGFQASVTSLPETVQSSVSKIGVAP